jgi:hypothetical protein
MDDLVGSLSSDQQSWLPYLVKGFSVADSALLSDERCQVAAEGLRDLRGAIRGWKSHRLATALPDLPHFDDRPCIQVSETLLRLA